MTAYPHNDYIEYHRGLAESHKILRHSSNHKSFFRTEIKEFQAETTNTRGLSDEVMLLHSLSGRLVSNESITQDEVSGGFALLVKLTNTEDQDIVQAAYDRAKEIGMDVVAKIHYDSMNACPRSIRFFELGRVRYEMTGLYPGNFVGYHFNYPIVKFQAFEYDSSKWQ